MFNSVQIQDCNSIQHCLISNEVELATYGYVRSLAIGKNMRLIDICDTIIMYMSCFKYTCRDSHILQYKTNFNYVMNTRQLILFSTNPNKNKQLTIKMNEENGYFFRCGIIEINKQFISNDCFDTNINCNTSQKKINPIMEFENRILTKAMQENVDLNRHRTGLKSLCANIWSAVSTCTKNYSKNNYKNDHVKPCSIKDNVDKNIEQLRDCLKESKNLTLNL